MIKWIANLRPVREAIETFQQWSSDDGGLLAAAVAYYAALSFFPLLLVLISVIGFFLRWTASGADAEQQVLSAIAEYGSAELQQQVATMLDRVQRNAAVGGPIGLITLLLIAIRLFAQFEKAFDNIWNVPARQSQGILAAIRSALFDRLRAFLMLLGVGGLILLTFIAGLALAAVHDRVPQWLPAADWVWWLVQTAISIGLNTAAFTLLYTVVPKVDVPWRKGLQGALVAAVVWEIGRIALAAFVISDKYSAYGVIGSFLAVMLWIYYASTVLFIGAEYVQVITRGKERQG